MSIHVLENSASRAEKSKVFDNWDKLTNANLQSDVPSFFFAAGRNA